MNIESFGPAVVGRTSYGDGLLIAESYSGVLIRAYGYDSSSHVVLSKKPKRLIAAAHSGNKVSEHFSLSGEDAPEQRYMVYGSFRSISEIANILEITFIRICNNKFLMSRHYKVVLSKEKMVQLHQLLDTYWQ